MHRGPAEGCTCGEPNRVERNRGDPSFDPRSALLVGTDRRGDLGERPSQVARSLERVCGSTRPTHGRHIKLRVRVRGGGMFTVVVMVYRYVPVFTVAHVCVRVRARVCVVWWYV